ncbi:MAG: ribosome silencing factor [Synergistales bacterium]|nr:ribosome silencing factor [Synergistales bacterium]
MRENEKFYGFEETLYRLDQKHAEDIAILDLRESTAIADFFIIVTANSKTHMKTLQETAEESLEQAGIECHLEGRESDRWRLVDGISVVVHIFSREGRSFYSLERIWGDVPTSLYSQNMPEQPAQARQNQQFEQLRQAGFSRNE